MFLVRFCLCFCFTFWRFAPETVWKILLMSGLVFWGLLSLVFGIFRRRRFCLPFSSFLSRDTVQVVTGHPRTRLFGFFVFSFCPAALGLSPFLAVRPAFWRFSGCRPGLRAFFGFSWNLRGLSSLAPSEAPFVGREAARVFCASCVWFLFPTFCFAATRFLVSPSRRSRRRGKEREISPAPRPSEGQGVPLEGGGLVPSLCCYCLVSCVWFWVTGTQRVAPRAFCLEGVPFSGCSLGSHTHVVFPAPGFFLRALLKAVAFCA